MEELLGIFEPIKNIGYQYSLICLILNLFISILPQTMVVFACYCIIILIALEIIETAISLFADSEDMGILSWLTIILNIIAVILTITLISSQTQVFELLQITNEISKFEWICTCLTIYFFIVQVLTLVPDIIGTLTGEGDY